MNDDAFSSFREERLEQRRKRPAILIGVGIGVVVAVAIGGLTFGKYVSLSGTANGELPIIRADTAPDGMPPKFAGGLDVPNRDKMVYERLRQNSGELPVERLLAPTEKPVAPAQPFPEDAIAALVEKVEAEHEPAAAIVKDEDGQAVEVVFKTVETAPKLEKKAPVKEVKKAPEPKDDAKTNEKAFSVQLVSARSRKSAEDEFKRLSKKHPELMAKIAHHISETTSDKGTFYRLRVGDFAARDDAKTLCDKFKAKKQECFVVNK